MLEREYTVREVARLVGINRKTVRRMIERGELGARITPSGRIYVTDAEVRRLRALERRVQAGQGDQPGSPVRAGLQKALRSLFG